MMKSGFLILNNICHVQSFTLNILSNAKPSDATSIDDKLTRANLRVDFKDRRNIPVKDPGKLCAIHGKLAFAVNVRYKEGKIDITWGGQDGSLTMRMNYEIVDAVDQAYSCDQFLAEIQEIIQKNRVLDESDDEQKLLHHFLIPHISGVLHDLYQLEHPVDASYELIGKRVKIHGIPETSLLEYGLNLQRDEGINVSMPVLMSGHEVEMHWNSDTEEWNLADSITNDMPRDGKLQIGYKNDLFNDGNKNHDHNKLRLMLTCLNDLKARIGSPGHENLRLLFADKDSNVNSTITSNSETNDIAKISAEFGLKQAYDELDDEQKRCIEDIFQKKVVSVNGEGGSGKTEAGAFATVIAAILGYRTIVTTETNPAIDNFLDRIDKKYRSIPNTWKRLNIVRLRSRKQIAPAAIHKAPDQIELEFEIKRLRKDINDHFGTVPESSPDFQLKRQFHDVFSRSDVLERFILLSYDIILATYGIICERKFFQDSTHLFDLNIIDASSSVNLSAFSLGARNSRRWIFLNDEAQIAPLTVGDFLLKQPLRFPEKEELQNAAKYDPKDADLKKSRVIWDSKKYKESAASILGHLDLVSSHFLKNQYRIHPDLYNKICKAFE
nr:hypothetical protein [Candidatus Sigynarchaeota archaeon]